MTHRLRPLAALTIVALIGAGCSNEPSTTGTATSTATATSAGDKTVQFAECMRKHGVSEFPDPDAASDQAFVEGIEKAQGSPAFKRALGACKDLRPPGLLGAKATPKEMTKRLEFARCIRANGVKDFPDPIDGEPLVDTNRIPSTATEGGMTILNAAMKQCSRAAVAALEDR